jgi:hypothetical protein
MASLISPQDLNAFNAPPKTDTDTLDECYDTNSYTQQQCYEAFTVICHDITDIERNGGVRCIDANNKAVSASKYDSLVSYVLSRPPRNGHPWQLVDTYLRTSVLALDGQKDGLVRIVLIHGPFCYAVHWKSKHTMWSENEMQGMMKTVLSAEYALVVMRLLITTDANLGALDRLDRSIHEGYLFAWAMLVHMHTRLHISAPVCSLFFQNWLSGTNVNQFSCPYTNLLREGNLHMVGSNARKRARRDRASLAVKQEHASSTMIRYDQNLDLSIAAMLSKERQSEQHNAVVQEVYALLGRDRLSGGDAVLASDAKHNRFKHFFCASTSILQTQDCALMRNIKDLHASSKQNQGNNAHHRAATPDEVRVRNDEFDKLVREGTYFWLPLTVVLDPNSIPAKGTKMAFGRKLQVTVDGVTAARRLSFKAVPPATFLPFVTHGSLLNRFGNKAAKTLQKAKRVARVATFYPNHRVMCVRGQYLKDSKIKLGQLEFNLLLCYIEEIKNAPTVKKIKIEPTY